MTLVELLVVISIIAVLMGLLLPAVQSVREGSSQVQCRNNLKQLGLGLLSYETSRGAFPPGCVYSGAVASQANMMYANWAILILPHLEQLQLFNQYDQSTYNMAPGNLPVLQTVLGVMNCPSDPSAGAIRKPFAPLISSLVESGIATGAYKGISGVRSGIDSAVFFDYAPDISRFATFERNRGLLHLVGTGYWPVPAPVTAGSDSWGMKGFRCVTADDVIDGLSRTLMVGEAVLLQNTETITDGQGFWASTLSHHGRGALIKDSWARNGDFDKCMQLINGKFQYCDRSFGSQHPKGLISFVSGDGAVRRIDPDIDGKIYLAWGTIAGREKNEPLEELP
jgi:type II secretory pathway pseudopilin PulG